MKARISTGGPLSPSPALQQQRIHAAVREPRLWTGFDDYTCAPSGARADNLPTTNEDSPIDWYVRAQPPPRFLLEEARAACARDLRFSFFVFLPFSLFCFLPRAPPNSPPRDAKENCPLAPCFVSLQSPTQDLRQPSPSAMRPGLQKPVEEWTHNAARIRPPFFELSLPPP